MVEGTSTSLHLDTQFGAIDEAVISLACAIGAGAKHTLKDHFKRARELGVSENDLLAIVSKSMCVKNSARDATNEEAYKNLDITIETTDCCRDEEVSKLKETAAIAAAVGTSCLINYHKHVRIGAEAGLSTEYIAQVTEHAFSIKGDLLEDFEYLVEHPAEAEQILRDAPEDKPCCEPGSGGICC